MTTSSPPSPAWLGFGAAFSFVGLAIAAFASGHHLVDREGAALMQSAVGGSAVVSEGKDAAGAPLRAAPDSSTVVGHLPAQQRVDVLLREGEWAKVRAEVEGKPVEGWTERANLSSP